MEEEASSSIPKIITSYFLDKPHILLVDYDTMERDETAEVFEANSCTVTKIGCELQAMRILLNEKRAPNKMPKIDMVCMELAPHLYASRNADWLLRAIKGSEALRDMHVVIVTDNPYARNECDKLGITAYIEKPIATFHVIRLRRHMGWMPRNILENEDKKRSARIQLENCNMLNILNNKPGGIQFR